MLASYTANLAAFLTSDRLQSTINGAEDLAKQSEIKYGCLRGGSTMKFFQDSNFSTFQRMWAAMEENGDAYMPTLNLEGVAKVEKDKGKYAFMMEASYFIIYNLLFSINFLRKLFLVGSHGISNIEKM